MFGLAPEHHEVAATSLKRAVAGHLFVLLLEVILVEVAAGALQLAVKGAMAVAVRIHV